MVLPAGLVSCASFAAIAFSTTPAELFAAMAAIGVSGGFVQPAIGSYTAEVTPSAVRGQALSLQRQANSLVSFIGPVSIGLLADAASCETAIVTTAGLMACCNVVYALRATAPTHHKKER
mmetsp:Transcript_28392/g.38821  ORF Transcript_28392/g.38821 Transcript_28392/m.38821 type:complete len:120 (-) Transcript_28392:363-722(-)